MFLTSHALLQNVGFCDGICNLQFASVSGNVYKTLEKSKQLQNLRYRQPGRGPDATFLLLTSHPLLQNIGFGAGICIICNLRVQLATCTKRWKSPSVTQVREFYGIPVTQCKLQIVHKLKFADCNWHLQIESRYRIFLHPQTK